MPFKASFLLGLYLLRKLTLGGIYGGARPDPIPNSAVKTARANDTLVHASGKVGNCPLYKRPIQKGLVFFCI